MKHITQAALARANAMMVAGASWNRIAREVGIGRDVIRCRIDADYAQKHRVNGGSVTRDSYDKLTADQLRALQDAVPRDTRNFTARAMGDPLPGRSALDRRVWKTQSPVKLAAPEKIDVAAQKLSSHIEDRHSNIEAVD